MSEHALAEFVRDYLDRVVNRRDLTALDDLMSPDYRGEGPGWPTDIASLRRFYEWQAQCRPDWRIDVQETVEVGDSVAVRAYAGGTIVQDDDGEPLPASFRRDVEWLAVYRVTSGRVAEIRVMTVQELNR
ncbi:MAG: nuclear transport factor 2 family protein [Mycobacteriales bacterium]